MTRESGTKSIVDPEASCEGDLSVDRLQTQDLTREVPMDDPNDPYSRDNLSWNWRFGGPKWRPFIQVDFHVNYHDSWKHFLDLAYWNVEIGEEVR